ncbi:hypothetical protein M413DRAFT_32066 [Hebeloma cylindrosporum]|uniref:ATP synthase subunit G ATP20 n=1 Tax=Hebeloma cylindrosporum TaxID=76867 RepID=A0A0C3BX43_HEBCY|nr:hypothetical protein M413DRAFT_32066 [Hebeloma cylindrosporum h7]
MPHVKDVDFLFPIITAVYLARLSHSPSYVKKGDRRPAKSASSFVRRSVARQAFLNQQRAAAGRRFQSSTPEQKAQDALATAKNYAGKFFEATKKFLGPVGDKAGQLLGSYKQPLLYNLSVTKELFKQIYVQEGMKPPTLDAYRAAYTSLWTQVKNPGFVREIVRSGELGRVGIYGLQAYGIFKIGEIFGRRSLVGYKINN